jgi:hypothetical protein
MQATLDRVCMAAVTRQSRQPDPLRTPGPVKRIWLLLYTEGGWWGSSEIRERLRMTRDLGTRQLINEMVGNGFLARRVHQTPEGDAVQYGVDRRCKVPRGVTIEEMWDILQITAQGKQG